MPPPPLPDRLSVIRPVAAVLFLLAGVGLFGPLYVRYFRPPDGLTADFIQKAERPVYAVITPQTIDQAQPALDKGAKGLILEGDFPQDHALKAFAEIRPRLRLDFDAPIIATAQAVWPGINVHDDQAAEAAPSGGPWIDTNAGYLRFARALAKPGAELWLANRPPAKTAVTVARYLQVIADAAIIGTRWVIALDDDFFARLQANDAKAVEGWRKINEALAFYEAHAAWRDLQPWGQLAVVQDIDSGGLLSGGILDMISVKHTPLVPVPKSRLSPGQFKGTRMTVNVDTGALTEAQRDALRQFTRGGGMLLSGPPGWRMPPPRVDQITLDKTEITKLEDIWKEVNAMTGRRNLGVRLFNVSSMLSNLTATPDGNRLVLHLVNYSDYPVDSITVHVLGQYPKATLVTPAGERALKTYDNEDGSGVDIDTIDFYATLILERN